jgi:hypothetical protein
MARYDADEDGKLGFWEFSNMLLPLQPIVRDEVERRTSQRDEFSPETKQKLKTLLRHLISAEMTVESIRHNIHKNAPVPMRQIFDQLDWLKRGFLTCSEIRRYFDGYPTETD